LPGVLFYICKHLNTGVASNLTEFFMQVKKLSSGTRDFTSSLCPVVCRLPISLGLL